MTPDIVGTASQSHFALLALFLGLVVGILGLFFNKILGKTKVRLFFADFCSTFILGITGILFCLHFLKGVFYLYVFLCETVGYAISFFCLQKIIRKLKLVFKRSNK